MSEPRSRLIDVARFAGVSLATASKALNGRSDVSPATRQRVRDAATRLAFVHSHTARGLASGRSATVGMMTSDVEGHFSMPVLIGAEDTLDAIGTSVLLCDARGDAIRERRLLDTLRSRQVDGVLVVGSYNDPRDGIEPVLNAPTVYVLAPSRSELDISVVPDNRAAGRLAAEHLLSVGRRRIAHITGRASDHAVMDRSAGIRDALARSDAALVWESAYGEWTERWGRSATTQLLFERISLDAIICDSDQIARGCLASLLAAKLRVPDDVALMGFDNWSLLTADSDPGITSVDLNLEIIGRISAKLLLAGLGDEPPEPGIRPVAPQLVVRGSTMPGS